MSYSKPLGILMNPKTGSLMILRSWNMSEYLSAKVVCFWEITKLRAHYAESAC